MASHKGKLGGRPSVNSEIQHWISFLQSGTEVINMKAGNKTCLQYRYSGSLFSDLIRTFRNKLYCCPTNIQHSRCLKWGWLASCYELLFRVDKIVINHRAAPASILLSPLNLWPPMAGRQIPLTFLSLLVTWCTNRFGIQHSSIIFVLFLIFVLFYAMFVLCRSLYCLCVNVYCTTATGWLSNCS